MRSHTIIRPPKDCVIAIDTVESRAARAGPPLVAREIILVAKIGTTRTLHNVAAHRGHVSQLSRCGEQQTFSYDRVAMPHFHMGGDITHSSKCTNAQPSIWQYFDGRHARQPVDIQQTIGTSCAVFDQTDEVSTARDECGMGIPCMCHDGGR